jgi:hypothetical protein
MRLDDEIGIGVVFQALPGSDGRVYEIGLRKQAGDEDRTVVTVDGVERPDDSVPLVDDRRNHSVEVVSIHRS